MPSCIAIGADNVLSIDAVTQPPDCAYVLIQSSEYTSFAGLSQLFATYFEFDPEIFALIVSSLFVTFLSGHFLGYVVTWLKRV